MTLSPVIKNAEALCRAAPDASTELVHLSEAEALGVVDDHDGGIGNIDADLNDGGGDENVDLAALETRHGDFFLVGAEAAMQQAETQAREIAGAQLVVHLGCRAEFGFSGGEELFGFDGFFHYVVFAADLVDCCEYGSMT